MHKLISTKGKCQKNAILKQDNDNKEKNMAIMCVATAAIQKLTS